MNSHMDRALICAATAGIITGLFLGAVALSDPTPLVAIALLGLAVTFAARALHHADLARRPRPVNPRRYRP